VPPLNLPYSPFRPVRFIEIRSPQRVSLLLMFGLHPLEIVIAISLIVLLLAVSLRK
jgi:hypothetical protein